jgi:ubiquinone/menaquinone biosynthesis C-methylase UbiE
MVTDVKTNYTSPAGKEFTLTAGRFAGIHPASLVLDIGCGYGEGICNLTQEFRCKAVAVDISRENIAFAQELAYKRKVSHLIKFINSDIFNLDFSDEPFDLILVEGGVMSFMGRRKALDLMHNWLVPRGWVEFSDLVLLSPKAPDEVLEIFGYDTYQYETEDSYRKMIDEAGYTVQFVSLVPPSGWDNYYAHMARRLDDNKGFFADKKVKLAFHREIDVFYRFEGFRFVGYLICIVRRKD